MNFKIGIWGIISISGSTHYCCNFVKYLIHVLRFFLKFSDRNNVLLKVNDIIEN